MVKSKISPGIFIAILGISFLLFGLSSETLSMLEKIPILIACTALIIIGILIETPVLDYLKGVDIPEEEFN